MLKRQNLIAAIAAATLGATTTGALADAGHGKAATYGSPGEEHHVSRTITVRMGEMYYKPSKIDVKPGETVRFDVINEGAAVHEFNIGTPAGWQSHMAEMERMVDEGMIDHDRIDHGKMRKMGMMHTDPNAVLLEPGENAVIVWKFPDRAAEIGFACNVPGHRESGMVGQVTYPGQG